MHIWEFFCNFAAQNWQHKNKRYIMKKILTLCMAAMMFASCAQVYKYVQVFDAQPLANSNIKAERGGMLYEDDQCIVFYSFWADGGDASFAIFNKTDKVMYVDLSKSFFIRNGIANDYYKDRAWSESSSNLVGVQASSSGMLLRNRLITTGVGATYLGNLGSLPLTSADPILTAVNSQATDTYGMLRSTAYANVYATGTSSSLSVKEQKILAIPPHASKIVAEYAINTSLWLYCDLARFPKDMASLTFEENESPLHFSNYITYHLGNAEEERVVENEFYISKVTNYAQPSIYKFVERKNRPCQNMTTDLSEKYNDKYPVKVYDKVYNFDRSNRFYVEYEIRTKRKLYKGGQEFYYDPLYDGYTTGGSDEQSDYRKRLLDPFTK